VTIPGLQRTTPLRHSASKTRVNALLLRCARETQLFSGQAAPQVAPTVAESRGL
jgi:hypothetical protein